MRLAASILLCLGLGVPARRATGNAIEIISEREGPREAALGRAGVAGFRLLLRHAHQGLEWACRSHGPRPGADVRIAFLPVARAFRTALGLTGKAWQSRLTGFTEEASPYTLEADGFAVDLGWAARGPGPAFLPRTGFCVGVAFFNLGSDAEYAGAPQGTPGEADPIPMEYRLGALHRA